MGSNVISHPRKLHLALFVTADGIHHGGWRHPSSQPGRGDFAFFRKLATQAEAAKFDLLFVADKLAIDANYGGDFAHTLRHRPSRWSEPLTLLSALAPVTRHIGLGGTLSTSYTEPFHAARLFASLDEISGGRAAWNAVTSVSDAEARNFSRAEHYGHDLRYARAGEFIEVVKKLWDSWDDGAIQPDPASGIFADASKVRAIDHVGDWFQVKGPLNAPRSPQGHPVILQAGASGPFLDLSARHAEVVFAVAPDLARGQAFYQDFKARVVAAGRARDSAKVLPGMVPIVAESDSAAQDLLGELDALVTAESGLNFMSGSMNYDLSRFPADGPVPDIRDEIRGSKGRFHYVIGHAIEQGWTLGELGRWYGSSLSFAKFVGSPKTVADAMEQWVGEGAADGFVVMPASMPLGADRFFADVVPILQQRGLFRSDYHADTLRGHLGLEFE